MRFEFSSYLVDVLLAAKMKNVQVVRNESSRAGVHVNILKFSKEDKDIFRKVVKLGKDASGENIYEIGKIRKMAAEIEAIWHVEDNVKVGAKCKNLKFLAATINKEIRVMPRRWYFEKGSHDALVPYFILSAFYHRAVKHKYGWSPAYVSVHAVAYERGTHRSSGVTFHREDLAGHPTVTELFKNKESFLATPEMLTAYDADLANYKVWSKQIGEQFVAAGSGETDSDTDHKDEDRWYRRRDSSKISLVTDGVASKLVMDDAMNFGENSDDLMVAAKEVDGVDTENLAEELGISSDVLAEAEDADDEDDDDDEDEDEPHRGSKLLGAAKQSVSHVSESDAPEEKEEVKEKAIKLPVHPVVRLFNLSTHKFVTCHVCDLKPYTYNTALIESLVLPVEHKEIIDALLNSALKKYADIITGKAIGIILLCSGPPGTGKTLTAEVYGEVAKRPLYMVQCSQLGTSSAGLENELLIVLNRSMRWNAILLIDEADVYIHERGDNIDQNAVVGTFLRVLEYYKGILFFTTNRATVVDDAIMSRVTAHIKYDVAAGDDRKAIWKILSKNYGVDFTDELLNKCVQKFPKISGRSIRQLMRLSKMMVDRYGGKVTLSQLERAARYHHFDECEEVSKDKIEDVGGDR